MSTKVVRESQQKFDCHENLFSSKSLLTLLNLT